MSKKVFIKVSTKEVPVYKPAGHENTHNRRLAGPHNGSEYIEFIIGEMHKGGSAENHFHADSDQMIYMLEGELHVVSPDREENITPGDLVVFPKEVAHEVQCKTDFARFVVLYGPPKQKA